MNTYIILKKKKQKKLPSTFIEDGRFDEGLLEYIINTYTTKDSKILDPFVGYGTTILVSEKLKRDAWGMEINKNKYLYAKSQIKNKDKIINDDAKNISKYFNSFFNICITSLTYSWKNMGCNPLNIEKTNEGYKDYLKDYKKIIKIVIKSLKKDGLLIIDASNISFQGISTTLAWDIKYNLEKISNLVFEKELVVCWDNEKSGYLGGSYSFGYDHSYCLIFRKK